MSGGILSYRVLVGQFLGALNIIDGDGNAAVVVAVRSGLQVMQMDARTAPLLAALDQGLREEPSSFYPEAVEDLDSLSNSGLVIDLEDPDFFDPAKFRIIPMGSGRGFDDELGDFKLHGNRSVAVPELAYWAWAYGSTCSSVTQLAELVAKLHPNAGAGDVVQEIQRTIASLHRSGCARIDAALIPE